MNNQNLINLPIAGNIQHGIQEVVNGKKKVKELGYFIAKTKDDNMVNLLGNFNQQFDKSPSIQIRLFDEEPLKIKRIRYNTAGAVCYCMAGKEIGKQRTKEGWKDIECNENCPYRVSENNKKSPCIYEGVLKFIIPSVSIDRVWIMRIKGMTSIMRLNSYFKLQHSLKYSLVGNYNLYLKKEQQTNFQGKTFENYILDITRIIKNNTNTNNSLSQNKISPFANQSIKQNTSKVPTAQNNVTAPNTQINKQTNIGNSTNQVTKQNNVPKTFTNQANINPFINQTVNQNTTTVATNQNNVISSNNLEETNVNNQNVSTNSINNTKTNTKTRTSSKTKQSSNQNIVENKETTYNKAQINFVVDNEEHLDIEPTEEMMNKYYLLVDCKNVKLDKNGKQVEYLVGEFMDKDGTLTKAVVPPAYAVELNRCSNGTSLLLDLEDSGKIKFISKLLYIQKCFKVEAA